jgi:hypothetical protein
MNLRHWLGILALALMATGGLGDILPETTLVGALLRNRLIRAALLLIGLAIGGLLLFLDVMAERYRAFQ